MAACFGQKQETQLSKTTQSFVQILTAKLKERIFLQI
jgi:hypothetical protein